MKNTKEKLLYVLYVCGIWFLLLTFFLKIRPPVVNNGDDWAYIFFSRPAVPVWNGWNPCRVLPECLMPLCAHIAVLFVMPLCHDYIWSITIVSCAVICLIITLYIVLFGKFLCRVMNLSAGSAMLCTSLLLVFHFKSWMSPWIASLHLFHSIDLNNYFFYTIPVLLNGMLVLWFEKNRETTERFYENENLTAKSFLVLMIYFAVFSNLFGNCVLAIYAGLRVLENLWAYRKENKGFLRFAKQNSVYLLVLVLWCVSAFFELNGGRASGFFNHNQSFIARVKQTVWLLLDVIERMDDAVFYSCIFATAAGILLLIFSRRKCEEDRKYGAMLIRYGVAAVLTAVYLVPLCAIININYIERMEVILGIMVYVFLVVFSSIAYVLKRCPKAELVLPLIICIMALPVIGNVHSFDLTNRGNTTEQALAVSRDLLEQVLSADELGLKKVEVNVPKKSSKSNWPYPLNMGGNMLIALKQHGMIKNVTEIQIVPDSDYESQILTRKEKIQNNSKEDLR